MVGAFFMLLILVRPHCNLNAQSVDLPENGLGLHLGITNGIDYKRHLNNGDALEILFSSQWDGVLLTALYQDQYDITDQMMTKNKILAFYGAGIHYGNFSDDSPVHPGSSLGVDFDMGIDQYFRSRPFSLGLEFRLIVDAELAQWNVQFLGDLALNFRYVF
jgi:hypothetical protein